MRCRNLNKKMSLFDLGRWNAKYDCRPKAGGREYTGTATDPALIAYRSAEQKRARSKTSSITAIIAAVRKKYDGQDALKQQRNV